MSITVDLFGESSSFRAGRGLFSIIGAWFSSSVLPKRPFTYFNRS